MHTHTQRSSCKTPNTYAPAALAAGQKTADVKAAEMPAAQTTAAAVGIGTVLVVVVVVVVRKALGTVVVVAGEGCPIRQTDL